jgi:hypothetical protein
MEPLEVKSLHLSSFSFEGPSHRTDATLTGLPWRESVSGKGPAKPRPDWQNPSVSLLNSHYDFGAFFDEMFVSGNGGGVRPHYRRLAERLATLPESEFEQRRAALDLAFLRRGVTFTVYSDSHPARHPVRRVEADRGRPDSKAHRAEPVSRRHLPRAEGTQGQNCPARPHSRGETLPP